ncbi:polysaccharide deacetylase family protein [Aestuariirhabdus litorea]|uniref:Polysaccharide deacetylase family protein n=1 Tax=Aestuariirhabdus litorea TaxID=2528527 RepID=A0A3P3VNY7_9GAMM|nr:polysaccharide deacetylase family protein [Aestuariirhabdus litorea]RRJ82533.1 polysaccharide deacetylase family protein [Aestuariirhabdus litorea]RWW92694.1 polysaccharide deacetylase family protein [Endozoicomonadaceae bacterium GTF-13]
MTCPILMYHFIGDPEDPADSPYFVSSEKFDEQMKRLKKRGFKSISLGHLFNHLYRDEALPDKSVVITFDDGHLSFYEKAMPVLEKYDLTATNFIITERAGKKNFMTWEQINRAKLKGFSIESHSVTHRVLTKINRSEVVNEALVSKKTIEKKLNSDVRFFCYRGGHYNEEIKSIVESCGYDASVCSRYGVNNSSTDRYELKRVPIRGTDDLGIFLAKIHGYDWQRLHGRLFAKYLEPLKIHSLK